MIPRRRFLKSAIAGIAVSALPRLAGASAATVIPALSANRRFSVLSAGDRIGAHTIAHSVANAETRIHTGIDLAIKALFFTVFAYSHHSEELWRDGRLTSLKSRTEDGGETFDVSGEATPLGFRGVGKGGPFIAPAGTLTSNSLWTPAALEQTAVVDAQHGAVIGVSARRIGDEQIAIGGRTVHAIRDMMPSAAVMRSIRARSGTTARQGFCSGNDRRLADG